jgi:hypothetical protein
MAFVFFSWKGMDLTVLKRSVTFDAVHKTDIQGYLYFVAWREINPELVTSDL